MHRDFNWHRLLKMRQVKSKDRRGQRGLRALEGSYLVVLVSQVSHHYGQQVFGEGERNGGSVLLAEDGDVRHLLHQLSPHRGLCKASGKQAWVGFSAGSGLLQRRMRRKAPERQSAPRRYLQTRALRPSAHHPTGKALGRNTAPPWPSCNTGRPEPLPLPAT